MSSKILISYSEGGDSTWIYAKIITVPSDITVGGLIVDYIQKFPEVKDYKYRVISVTDTWDPDDFDVLREDNGCIYPHDSEKKLLGYMEEYKRSSITVEYSEGCPVPDLPKFDMDKLEKEGFVNFDDEYTKGGRSVSLYERVGLEMMLDSKQLVIDEIIEDIKKERDFFLCVAGISLNLDQRRKCSVLRQFKRNYDKYYEKRRKWFEETYKEEYGPTVYLQLLTIIRDFDIFEYVPAYDC